MRRQTQQAGIRSWYGHDILDLQAEPLKVLDGFFSENCGFIVSGCRVTATGDKYNISSGLVSVQGTDQDGAAIKMVAPFAGAENVSLPIYLFLALDVVEDQYNDGVEKPIVYDYSVVATNVKPAGSYVTITAAGAPRFVDAIQDSIHRFITDTERGTWNAKETTVGSQNKADTALTTAKGYTDTRETAIRSSQTTGDTSTLQAAKIYADQLIQQIVNGSPAALDTLQELASALGNDPNFATTVLNQLSGKANTDLSNATLTQLVSTNGYVKLPGGVMIQWGTQSSGSSTTQPVTVYFPIAFYATPFMGLSTPAATSSASSAVVANHVTNKTTTYLSVVRRFTNPDNGGNAGEAFYWLAIGRWK